MKNNYELKQTTILAMENETLRERIKEMKLKIKKLEEENEKRKMVQKEGDNATTQE